MLTIEEAQLQPGEVLQATAANVRVEMEGEALRLLKLLDTDEPATINDCVYQVADLEVEGPEELEHLFQLILTKALSTPQAAAACTDMMCGLRERYAGAFEEEGQRPVKSTRLLLNVVQFNYEKLFDPDSIAQQKRIHAGNWWSGWMQVFGHLLMRRLIAARVVGQVVHEMIGIKEETPEKLPEEGRGEGGWQASGADQAVEDQRGHAFDGPGSKHPAGLPSPWEFAPGLSAEMGMHVKLFQQLQETFLPFDAYARVCLMTGVSNVVTAFSYFWIAHQDWTHEGSFLAALSGSCLLMFTTLVLYKLDLYVEKRRLWIFKSVVLCAGAKVKDGTRCMR
eukprot:s226_g23.t1